MARRSRVVTRGARRLTTWVSPADQGFVAVTSGNKVIISSFAPSAFGIVRPTVVRSRGRVSIVPSSFAADLEVVGAFGMCVVSDQAFAAGVLSVPGPFTDAEWDGWFVWQPFGYVVDFDDATSKKAPAHIDVEVDSKAMRKVTDNETEKTYTP